MATALLLCTSLGAADAASSAQAASTTAATTSGSWGAVATTSTAAPYGTGPLALTFSVTTTTQYFDVVNTGTLPLTGATFTAATTASSADIEACSTTWNETTGRCPSGTITTVTTTGAEAKALAAPLPAAGSMIRLRAKLSAAKPTASTVTIGVEVSRVQARAATTTGN